MDEQRWHTINQILDTAISLDEETRLDYVKESCGDDALLADEIIALLGTFTQCERFWDTEKKISETLLRDYSLQIHSSQVDDAFSPFQIGKYETVEVIGRGGMGTVYKARRMDGEFERYVAIKVVNEFFVSDSIIERFKRERQILARLNHPNIAVLYDGGVMEDGRPYLVMELIPGKPVTDYCADHQLSLAHRIDLLKKLYLTVHYAHQNLVVHRDLKPSNILVTENGALKVLDFGIAQLLEEGLDDENGTRLLSLQYASPDQFRNQAITTASDIYNLGLIGYELLCHQKPFDFSDVNRAEAEEIIVNKSAAVPSQKIPSDLMAILLKALQKKPEDRYSSALELHQDLEDYQQKRPVKAVSSNRVYKIRKFFSRNSKIASAVLGFVLTLSILLVYHFRTISIERDQALEEAEKARITSSFMAGIFKNADYTRDDEAAITSNQFLDDGVQYIHRDLSLYPDVQAQLLETVASIHHHLGHLDKAEGLYLESARIREELPADHPDKHLLASCYHNLGTIFVDKGNYSKAERYFSIALQKKQQEPNIEISSIGNTMVELGWVWFLQGKTSKVDSILSVAKTGYETAHMTNTMLYSNVLQSLAWVNFSKGNEDKSDSLFRAALNLREHLFEDDAPRASQKAIAQTLHSLGWITFVNGDLDEAADLTQRALDIREQTYGRNHFETAWTMNNLGLIERARHNRERAGRLLQEAYEIRRALLGDSHPHTIQSLNNLKLFEQDIK